MLGLVLSGSAPASIPKSITTDFRRINPCRHSSIEIRERRTRFVTLASNGEDPITTADEKSEDRRPLLDFKWSDLLNPDADNVLAVGLTGLLTWASVQVLWQLLFISFAILVAAVKYSFIAAILLFILITLL